LGNKFGKKKAGLSAGLKLNVSFASVRNRAATRAA
jgi:hypothetical protein